MPNDDTGPKSGGPKEAGQPRDDRPLPGEPREIPRMREQQERGRTAKPGETPVDFEPWRRGP